MKGTGGSLHMTDIIILPPKSVSRVVVTISFIFNTSSLCILWSYNSPIFDTAFMNIISIWKKYKFDCSFKKWRQFLTTTMLSAW